MRLPRVTVRRMMAAVAVSAVALAMVMRPRPLSVSVMGVGALTIIEWSDGTFSRVWGDEPVPVRFVHYRVLTRVDWSDGTVGFHLHPPWRPRSRMVRYPGWAADRPAEGPAQVAEAPRRRDAAGCRAIAGGGVDRSTAAA